MFYFIDLRGIFDEHELPVQQWIDVGVDYLVTNWRAFFQSIKWPVDQVLSGIEGFLVWLPAEFFILAIFLIGWRAASIWVGLFSAVAFTFIGFMGLWSEAMLTLAMVIAAVVFCVLVGIPVGILSARSDTVYRYVRPILDIFQTTPAFVYLVPVVMLLSIGNVSGVIATIIFAIPPIIRLTNLGIRQVAEDVVEAAEAFGSSKQEILWKIQVPLAMPTMMAGLNQTIMLSLSMVVIASLIGAKGLGDPVNSGLNRLDVGLAGIGGIGIVLMAIVLDRITEGLGRKSQHDS